MAIYQFDMYGRFVHSYQTAMDAAIWIKAHIYDLPYLFAGADLIEFTANLNDDEQCLRHKAFCYYWSRYSFLGDL